MPDLAIVIPAWNERDNLALLLPELHRIVARMGVAAEIVVADAGSTDGTAEFAKSNGTMVVIQSERGYGRALLAGFASTRAPWIITMDADLSHPPDIVERFWERRTDADLIIASRFVQGGACETTLFRYILSRILNTTFRTVLSLPVRDLSSGFRCYSRDVLMSLAPTAHDFDFLQEVLVSFYAKRARIIEIPFQYRPRKAGRSHVRLVRFGWAYARTLCRMWWLSRHLRPDAARGPSSLPDAGQVRPG